MANGRLIAMKKMGLLLLIACAVCSAQNPASGVISALAPSGALVTLEPEHAQIAAHTKGFMAYSSKAYYVVHGSRSPVRFQSPAALTFVLPSSPVDPSTLFMLRRLTATKKSREVQILSLSANPFGARITDETDSANVPLSFTRTGASIRATTGELKPGEYAMSTVGSYDFYCFGVD